MITDVYLISLLTVSYLLNNTTDNQGDHCIVAIGLLRPAVEPGNQSLLGSAEQCAALTRMTAQALPGAISTFLAAVLGSELGIGGAG